jgi:4-hydroxybenzoate polyprenyltransferase
MGVLQFQNCGPVVSPNKFTALPMPALAGLLAAASHMTQQIRTLDIDDADQCLRLFK